MPKPSILMKESEQSRSLAATMTQRGVSEGYDLKTAKSEEGIAETFSSYQINDGDGIGNNPRDKEREAGDAAVSSSSRATSATATPAATPATGLPSAPIPSPPPPDGGILAWMQVVTAFFVFANTWGLTNTFGVFQSYYQTELLTSRSASDISWIGTIQSCFLGFGATYSGPLYDYGYMRILVCAGGLFIVIGTFLTSLCHEYWQVLLAQGLFTGIGLGCLLVPSASIVASFFAKNRSTALGVMSAGSCIGGVIYPIIFNRLVGRVGFGWATRAIGFVMIPQLLLPTIVFRQRIKPAKVRAVIDQRALLEPDFILFGFALLIGYTGAFIPFYYIQLYCSERDIISSDLDFYLLPIMNAVSLFGRTAYGRCADKIGPLNAFITACIACAALLFGWVGVVDEGGILAFTILYGIFSSGLIAVPTAVIAVTLSPTIQDYPVRLTMQLIFAGTGLLIGNPIAGALLERGWVALQVFGGACCVVSTVLCIIARVYRVGVGLDKKI